MELKNISENIENKTLISQLTVGLGLEHLVDNSYIVLAKFKLKGSPKKYYASAEDIKSVYNKASQYIENPEFEGVIYHVSGSWGVPISPIKHKALAVKTRAENLLLFFITFSLIEHIQIDQYIHLCKLFPLDFHL